METKVIINILDNQLSSSKGGIVEITDTLTKEIIERLNEQDKALDKACEDVYYCTQNCDSFAFCNVCKYNGDECRRKDVECLDDPFREKEKGIELVKQFYLESEKQ